VVARDKKRLDVLMAEQGLAPSRARAQALILAAKVRVDGQVETKAGTAVALDSKIEELERKLPQLNVKEYMEELDRAFTERSFMPLDDVWERELGDLFSDLGD